VGLDGVNIVKVKQSKGNVDNNVEVVISDQGMDQRTLLSKVINPMEVISPTLISKVIKFFTI
jgi:hypothetical protein